MKNLSMIIAFVAMMISPMMQAQNVGVDKDSIVGIYTGEELNEYEVYKVGDKYFAKIIKLQVPNDPPGSTDPLLDKHNPDSELKKREVKGITFLEDCVFDYDEWENGRYYDYVDGKTHTCKLRFVKDPDDNKLKLRVLDIMSSGGDKTTYWTKKKTN